jgi:hypothetical protein
MNKVTKNMGFEQQALKYVEKGTSFFIEKNNEIVYYSETIKGTKVLTNYIWLILLLLFGIGFSTAGLSSYFIDNKNYFFLENFSNIEFLPQGILLLFYGTCAILLSILISILIKIDIGAGKNEYDVENKVVRITRKGFPILTKKLNFKQKNIYFVYPFSELENIELEIVEGINPNRVIYLMLKDGRRIPLSPSNKLEDLLSIESKAIYIAKLLKIDLKLNDKSY